jgi:hypothetical protein
MIRFSPLEERVLELLGEQWHTLEELKRLLFPEHAPERVKSAVAFLRRKQLVQLLERDHGQPFLEQTPLGAEVLADYRASQRPLHMEGLRLAT